MAARRPTKARAKAKRGVRRKVARRKLSRPKRKAARRKPRRTRPRRTVERKHTVRGVMRVQELTKTGTSLRLKIYTEGEKIGELEIGRGSLFWRGGKRWRRKRLDWSRFAKLMDDLAYE